jgi:hypothetical protein
MWAIELQRCSFPERGKDPRAGTIVHSTAMRGWLLLVLASCAPMAEPPREPDPASERPSPRVPTTPPRAGQLAFWLVSTDTWRSTLYWLADGDIMEGETLTTASAPDIEPVGTLRWLTGCGARGGCSIGIRCPLRGPIEGAPPRGGACAALETTITSRCSDGLERRLRLSLDGRCAEEEGPRASLVVAGEPISDGEIAGWAPAEGLRYVPCGSLGACRNDVASLLQQPRSVAAFGQTVMRR